MDMKTFTKCSLIISTYNWPEALKLCLLSVREQSILPDEIVIADDGSTYVTTELIEAMRLVIPVRIVHVWQHDEGFQLSRIRNKAIAKSVHEYIIQIDGDLILHKDFIKDHLRICKPGSFVTGCRTIMNQELTEELLFSGNIRVPRLHKGLTNFCNRFSIPRLSNLLADRYRTRDIFALRGCNMAFWKEDLIRVNGYNELFNSWGFEDNDIAVRLFNSGLTKRMLKFGGVVFHLFHRESQKLLLPGNDEHLSHAIERREIACILGLSQYLDVPHPLELAENVYEI